MRIEVLKANHHNNLLIITPRLNACSSTRLQLMRILGIIGYDVPSDPALDSYINRQDLFGFLVEVFLTLNSRSEVNGVALEFFDDNEGMQQLFIKVVSTVSDDDLVAYQDSLFDEIFTSVFAAKSDYVTLSVV